MKLQRDGKLLAFGGCYSNLQATQALLDVADRLGIAPANMVCNGDIIAYGADAAATLGLIRDAGIVAIKGNCEESLSRKSDDCGCGFATGSVCDALAVEWYGYASRSIDDADRRFMAALPDQIEIDLAGKMLRFVHGNVDRINAFVFPSVSDLELIYQIDRSGCDAVIAGHSGIPFTRNVDGKIWHNTGSIGMPANDGTPRGWFSIIEVHDGEITITSRPLTYDFIAAAEGMRCAKLPEGYAAALETGIWPSLDILPAADRYFTGVPMEAREVNEPVPVVSLQRLETLWINTGTLCNLACTKCFMESTPTNDSLVYFSMADFSMVLAEAPATLKEVGFTGGEPFMNPDIIPMLEAGLAADKSVLVLTNAMRPLQRHEDALGYLVARYPGRLSIRVSLDHYLRDQHELVRGLGGFASSLTGLLALDRMEAKISVASRTPWGETEAMMRAGFAELFAKTSIRIDAYDSAALILFPEMDDGASEAARVTDAVLKVVPADRPLMCKTSRMVVRRKNGNRLSFTPCTLRPNADMGHSLAPASASVALDHPHCGQFCVYGGASCAGAPG